MAAGVVAVAVVLLAVGVLGTMQQSADSHSVALQANAAGNGSIKALPASQPDWLKLAAKHDRGLMVVVVAVTVVDDADVVVVVMVVQFGCTTV